MKLNITLLLYLGFITLSMAQNVEEVKKAKPVVFNGFLNSSYATYNGTRSDIPNSWAINASATMTLYGVVSLPFTLQLSDRKLNYNRPTFNRFGISPIYKKMTLHAGYRNMNFSPYIMSGYTFLGGGVELNPKKLRFSAMYGKLEQEWYAPTDNVVAVNEVPKFYDRIAMGAKIGLGTDNNHYDFFLFKIKDNTTPLLYDALQKIGLLPMENIIIGNDLKFTLFKRVQFFGAGAISGITENQNALPIPIKSDYQGYIENASQFMTINTSSRYAFAYNGGINFNFNKISFGGKYEHIDPFYRSLALYNLPNDVENITFNSSLTLFKGKAQFSATYGVQRNNLKGYQSASYLRKIGAANLVAQLHKQLTANVSYANFTMNYQPKLITINDTLRFANENSNASLNLNYSFKKNKKKSHNITLFISQNSFTEVGSLSNNFENTTLNGNLNYRISDKKNGYTVRSSLTYNSFYQGIAKVERRGITLGANKDFTKKLQVSTSMAYSKNFTENTSDGYIMRVSADLNFQPIKKHSLSFNISQQARKTKVLKPFNELQTRLSYGISF